MAQNAKSDFDPHDRKLTTAFLAPPVVWLTHLSVSYALVPQACASQTMLLLHLMTLLGLAITIAACVYCFQLLRVIGAGQTDGASREMRRRFMIIGGTVFGVVFSLLILATQIPNLIFRPCV